MATVLPVVVAVVVVCSDLQHPHGLYSSALRFADAEGSPRRRRTLLSPAENAWRCKFILFYFYINGKPDLCEEQRQRKKKRIFLQEKHSPHRSGCCCCFLQSLDGPAASIVTSGFRCNFFQHRLLSGLKARRRK